MLVCDFGVNVFLRISKDFMALIRGPMMMVTRCVSVRCYYCVKFCLLLGRISAGPEVSL